jgi:hypothetical protein
MIIIEVIIMPIFLFGNKKKKLSESRRDYVMENRVDRLKKILEENREAAGRDSNIRLKKGYTKAWRDLMK